MNNINRFQGQGHRLGGNQNLNQGRTRQVGQQVAQVAVSALQQNAQQAVQVAANAPQANAQVATPQPLLVPPQIPLAPQLQVLIQQNLQTMQVNNPIQNDNQRMANFVQDVIRKQGPLPENVVKLTNDKFVFSQDRLQDIGNLVTYLKDVVKNATIISAQCFNALPNEDGETLLDNHLIRRQSQNDGSICFCLDGRDKIFVDGNLIDYYYNSTDNLIRNVKINLADNDKFIISTNNINYKKSPVGSKLSIDYGYTSVVTVENTRNTKKFTQKEVVNRGSIYKQDLNFDDQGILTGHFLQDTRGDIKYDILKNRVTTRNRVIDLGQNPNLLAEVVTGNIMQLAVNANNFQVNYNGTNINIPFNQVNRTGTMNDLIIHHNEVMSQLHRYETEMIDDEIPILDLTVDGNRAEAIDGNWNNGYVYYDRDGKKKYEYIKDDQGNNQIRTYHPDIEVPSFDIVTQSNLKDLESATYTYTMYDRRGDTLVQQEQIVNNDIEDTIAFNITPIINQLVTNNDIEEEAKINALLRRNIYNPTEVFHTIESIR